MQKKIIDAVCPKIVIPMHYHTKQHAFYLENLDDFLQLFDKEQVEIKPDSTLELDDVPQNEKAMVIVLQKYEE